ncbi:MAG TPA: cobyric acid synthase [Steroidobacteraceae bacterium]|jgi:adenosylcobyric acid synthase
MPSLMLQGCGSDVGKSLLVAGLCRLFTNRGLVVRPFKPQNMSNNAAVTADGGEIGRAQALQALACRTPPTVQMNPVLLKPQGANVSQLIVLGQRVGDITALSYGEPREHLLRTAVESYRSLQDEADLVLVEGAGSPAETNLRAHDIANMGFAHAADVPVILAADIERGHAIAALAGAHTVLDAADRNRIRGFLINKFRGDARLFSEGLLTIQSHTGWPGLGVVPWLPAAARLPAEDAASLESLLPLRTQGLVRIGILKLPHIANFDDFDPLLLESQLSVQYVLPSQPLPADLHLVVIPGTKSTIADLEFLYAAGWHIDLAAHVRRGGRVLGICGGYQMLGRTIDDRAGIEGAPKTITGLGYLDVHTVLAPRKTLRSVSGRFCDDNATFSGYEMHMGVTDGPDSVMHPCVQLSDGSFDGAVSNDRRVMGCYVHGLFQDTNARQWLLNALGTASDQADYGDSVDSALDEIAAILASAIDIDTLMEISRTARS